MKRHFVILSIVVLLCSGCAPVNKNLADYDRDIGKQYPPTGLYLKRPSTKLQEHCTEFDDSSSMNYCTVNPITLQWYWDEMRKSGLFERVLYGEGGAEYEVYVALATYNTEDAGDFSKILFSSATMLMVPVELEKVARVEIVTTWNGIPIQNYEYELPYKNQMSIFMDPQGGRKNLAETIVSYFLRDAQQDDLFSPEFLNAALDASNYREDLEAPEAIGGFHLESREYFNNPLQGTRLTYLSSELPAEKIDVFVYPIVLSDWSDTEKTLKHEINRVRNEIKLAGKENQWSDLEMSKAQRIEWEESGDEFVGYFLDGSVTLDDGTPRRTSAYVFMQRDKFIKYRATLPADIVTDLVHQTLPEFEVPGESLFMARLRQAYR